MAFMNCQICKVIKAIYSVSFRRAGLDLFLKYVCFYYKMIKAGKTVKDK